MNSPRDLFHTTMVNYCPDWDFRDSNSIPPEMGLDCETGKVIIHLSQPPMARTSEDKSQEIIHPLCNAYDEVFSSAQQIDADINFPSKNPKFCAKFYVCSGAAVSRENQESFLREAIVNPALKTVFMKPTRVVQTPVPLHLSSTPDPQKKPDPKIGAAYNHSPLGLTKLPKQRPTFQPEENQLLLDFIESEPAGQITNSSWKKVAALINEKFKQIHTLKRRAKDCRAHYNYLKGGLDSYKQLAFGQGKVAESWTA
ncbi:uncharacterized protein PGTG_17439 [Puccinia graminis f. sp. tritici CRL 75-36-700-3]|uniref:Myb-like domain-containing protein n=1 Tax=Puccinia graminis f. sp. tritici (strain CRL 75-36-700-3 / race SCCL) TaxID=418459 RepID=E3L6F9_PUCGT|nr:uncharacterized protein PGTG_17439 [Puccinia graminis f. sp. tritici CRL 75-36-700-3]EFP92134.1 hypothetical protein PGTG_17439 [Puccinia graminis f. sp. tritici CRL 75-36-700-3]